MQRFFVPFPLSIDLDLTDINILYQLTRVLRARVGDHIVLFDGDGSETEYEMISIERHSIGLRGVGRTFPQTESRKSITLYQSLPNKIEKIEYILQKWVEVWVSRFIFFRSDRSQKLVISDSKIARLRTIAREAVEQCWGLYMPEVVFLMDQSRFPSSLQWQEGKRNIVLDTLGVKSRITEYDDIQDIGLWVGPEWGWSEEERWEMNSNGFIFAHFSDRVLRTETAGIVVGFALLNA